MVDRTITSRAAPDELNPEYVPIDGLLRTSHRFGVLYSLRLSGYRLRITIRWADAIGILRASR